MEENIKKILDDLYEIEPELRSREVELVSVIKTLLAAKPEIVMQAGFQERLKAELLQKFSTNNNQVKEIKNNLMNKLYYALGGTVIVAVLAISFYFYQSPTKFAQFDLEKTNNLANLDLSFSVTKVDNQAFGSLSIEATQFSSPRPQSGGGGGGLGLDGSSSLGFGGGGGMMAPNIALGENAVGEKMIMPYQPISYNYIYVGDTFSIDNEQMPIYKRQKNFLTQNNNLLNNLNLSLVDLKSFNNTKIQNFTLVQDETDGYFINIDLNEGMISINENWNQWYANNEPGVSLRPEEVPADNELIKIADKFLADHNVNLDTYGPGEVDNSWRLYYESIPASVRSDYFIAPSFTVLYPLNINGQTVYEQGGNKDGLRVTVNTEKNKVSSAYNITSQKYLSSDYQVETNVDKILALIKQGGIYPDYYDPASKILDVEVGTPVLVYIRSWSYQNNISEEILSPALIFPITKKPTNDEFNYFWRQNIVVPLVKEIFEQRDSGGVPIPLMEKAQ